MILFCVSLLGLGDTTKNIITIIFPYHKNVYFIYPINVNLPLMRNEVLSTRF